MDRTVETYSIGEQIMEYSISGQEGEPVLVLHGGHSNCHETFGYEELVASGFKLITPSRAGYGNTSESMGKSLDEACRYYMQLLDHLAIETIHVIAISAGGPSGLYLAAHFPGRVKTLTLQSAVTKEWHTPQDKLYRIAGLLFHSSSERTTWKLVAFFSNWFPRFLFKQMSSSFSKLSYQQIKEKMSDDDIEEVRLMNNRQRSGFGFLIDLSQTKEITSEDLQLINCRTLIMHSKYDGAVPLSHAEHAHQYISTSELCWLDSWGHLIWLGQDASAVNRKVVDFLQQS